MRDPPAGCYPRYPKTAYLDDLGLGSGAVRLLAESPAASHAAEIAPRESSDEMEFGTAFHMRLLEPHRYARHVVELDDDVSFATREGKALRAALAQARDVPPHELTFLKRRQVVVLEAMLAGLATVEDSLGIDPFGEPGEAECAHFWDDRDGLRGKAMVDKKVDEFRWLLDVKTTRRPLDDRSLLRHAAESGWAVQAAWYTRGVARSCPGWDDASFAFVVFQTTPPFSVRFMPVPPETLAAGARLVERALDNHVELVRARATGRRPRDPSSGVLELRYPAWFLEARGLS